MTNIVFIKGAKQSVVDFINRGLKGCKSKVRIPLDMTGEQIADRLNGHGCPITMHSYLPMPVTFLHYDTVNGPACFSEWYQYNGLKDELVINDVSEDPRFEEYKAAYGKRPDYNPKIADPEASYKVLEGYVQNFLI